MKMKKYLVTGGTGFIGSALVKRLVREGFKVRVLDNNLRGVKGRLEGVLSRIEFMKGDIRDAETVSKACKGVDGVCHLAYVNGTEFFYTMPELVLDIAVKGMVNVLDGCIKHRVKELILASSSEVYQTPLKVPTDETAALSVPDPMNPRYSYGGGKIICELMAINYGRKYFKRTVIFRPHNVYGPDMGFEHVIPQLTLKIREIIKKAPDQKRIVLPIKGTGKETRAFVYIDDFIDGLMKVIKKGRHLNIYHIGTMQEVSIRELAEEIGRYFGKKVTVLAGAPAPGGTLRRCPEISKLKKLGYIPKVSLKQGIRKICGWYDGQANLQSRTKGLSL